MTSGAPRDRAARWGRLGAASSAIAVTVVAMLGGAGVLPTSTGLAATVPDPAARSAAASGAGSGAGSGGEAGSAGQPPVGVEDGFDAPPRTTPAPLPRRSGTGRRVVFSEGQQRVWLVGAGGAVRRTYLVSGSLYDNLDPGTYAVFSRSEQAWGYDDTGTMEWFVRFTRSDSGGNIGFHDIPIDDGAPVQTVAELGTPLSHGCIRQRESDARALWRFAPLGTTVVVTA